MGIHPSQGMQAREASGSRRSDLEYSGVDREVSGPPAGLGIQTGPGGGMGIRPPPGLRPSRKELAPVDFPVATAGPGSVSWGSAARMKEEVEHGRRMRAGVAPVVDPSIAAGAYVVPREGPGLSWNPESAWLRRGVEAGPGQDSIRPEDLLDLRRSVARVQSR